MPLNRRSRLITHGVARSPNRAMLRAVGFGGPRRAQFQATLQAASELH
jgi:hypothetical protein